jgi:hypothetical protein
MANMERVVDDISNTDSTPLGSEHQRVAGRSRSTSWSEIARETPPRTDGIVATSFVVGDANDVEAPLVMRVYFPPGCRIEAHTHECDYAEVILDGSQQVGRTWHRAGDVRVAKAGMFYGPLVAGPEGATVLVIFGTGHHLPVGMKLRGQVVDGKRALEL